MLYLMYFGIYVYTHIHTFITTVKLQKIYYLGGETRTVSGDSVEKKYTDGKNVCL